MKKERYNFLIFADRIFNPYQMGDILKLWDKRFKDKFKIVIFLDRFRKPYPFYLYKLLCLETNHVYWSFSDRLEKVSKEETENLKRKYNLR